MFLRGFLDVGVIKAQSWMDSGEASLFSSHMTTEVPQVKLKSAPAKSRLSAAVVAPVAVIGASLAASFRALCPNTAVCTPTPSLAAFWSLSYGTNGSHFEKGPDDALFVLAWIGIFAVAQWAWGRMMHRLAPRFTVADHNEKSRGAVSARFAEQSFLCIYYILSVSAGIFIWANEKYFPFRSHEFWTDQPVARLTGFVKAYYLVQIGFWVQQLATLALLTRANERRKDHWAMTTHHIITTLLLVSSYAVHLTRIGNAVLVIMDTADVFLCLAKCLKYLGKRFQTVCDATFGAFVFVWLVTRHGLYFWIMRSIFVDGTKYTTFPNALWDPYLGRQFRTADDYKRPGTYMDYYVIVPVYLTLLVALQSLLIFWFSLILKVVIKVVRGQGAEDVREDEDD